MTGLVRLMEASWPPAAVIRQGPVLLRQGSGGGQRVSAASVEGDWTEDDLTRAETAMRQMGQEALFLVTPQDGALDLALAKRGYQIKDPVLVYAAPARQIAAEGPPHMTTFTHWPPLNIAATLWADGHVGPERLAIMQRALGPKTVLLARANERAAGVAFAALSGPAVFVHALHVAPEMRRGGSGRNLMRAAALWADHTGAETLALAVTEANQSARALYASLGMEVVESYHYRRRPA
jgi:GNAT superfamily N-acetyltransferase